MLATRTLLALAIAQSLAAQAQAQAVESGDDNASVAQLEEVVVVGSRIRRVDIETSQPVFVLEREQLLRTGLVSVGDILQDLTTQGATFNTTFNNGGNGQTRIDLRNLGDKRTLVLVNGRRWNTDLDGGVDLNSVPLAIVERIEVLKDGASVIYGSDAIAGVVNIHTIDSYDGAEADAYLGESAEGDGRVENYGFTIGANGERANVVLNASYVKQEPIYAGEREISAVPIYGLPPTDNFGGGSASTPLGRFGFGPAGNCPYNPAGTYPGGPGCNGRQGRPPTATTTFDPATDGYRTFNRRTDAYNFAPENYLQTPQERTSVYAQGRYALNDAITATTEFLYNQRQSAQQLATSPLFTGVNLAAPLRFAIPADHVYNPFGQAVSFLSLRPGGQQRGYRQDADTVRFGAGLEGMFSLFDRSYAWDLSAIHSEQEEIESQTGQLNTTRLAASLGPSYRDAGGVARCGTPDAPLAACVPFDPFRGPDAFTAEMLQYLYFRAQNLQTSELDDYLANLTGDLFDLPAGPLAFAAGYEHRSERGEFIPDATLASGAAAGTTPIAIGGSTSVDEYYVEFNVPILAALPLAEVLEANVAARRSDYQTFGATTNYKGGLRWKPHESLLLRGNYSQGFRAPSLEELYDADFGGLGDVLGDPCVDGNSPTDPAGCAADGVPGGSYEPERFVYDIRGGGNVDLGPETAVSRTLGLVWSPGFARGLDVALDWYQIEIDDAIVFPDGEFLLQSCVLEQVENACARTQRDPATGELLELDVRPLNSGTTTVEGYDLTVRYAFDTAAGRFGVLWDSTYTAQYVVEVPAGADPLSLPGNYTPFEPGWRVRSNIDFYWSRGDWGASVGTRYYAPMDEGCFLSPFYVDACSAPEIESPAFRGFPENRIDERWYVDVQASWSTPWNAQVRAGIQNVFDQDPPVAYSSFGNSFDPAYPVPGRFWYLSYTQSF